jgi:hypothetical protein
MGALLVFIMVFTYAEGIGKGGRHIPACRVPLNIVRNRTFLSV